MKNPNKQTAIRSSWLNDVAPVKLMVASLAVLAATVIHLLAQGASHDANVKLTLHLDGPNLAIHWPSQSVGNGGTAVFPWFEVQRSTDLNQWQPLGERQRGSAALPDLSLSLALGTDQPGAFYRLLEVQQPAVANLGSGGAEVFGYGDAFTQALQGIGQISPDEFAARFPSTASYLPAITWDPTTAQYWDLFSVDPAVVNEGKQPGDRGYRPVDTRLNAQELAIFQQNGFVVSGPPGGASFAEVFYNLFYSDLPIFVSTDALLEAWHRTYDAILEETEETYLFNSVGTMLDGMAGKSRQRMPWWAAARSGTVCATRIGFSPSRARCSRAPTNPQSLPCSGKTRAWPQPWRTSTGNNSCWRRTSWASVGWWTSRSSRSAGTIRIQTV